MTPEQFKIFAQYINTASTKEIVNQILYMLMYMVSKEEVGVTIQAMEKMIKMKGV